MGASTTYPHGVGVTSGVKEISTWTNTGLVLGSKSRQLGRSGLSSPSGSTEPRTAQRAKPHEPGTNNGPRYVWENNFTKAHVPRARTGEWTGTAGNNYGYDQLETPYGYRRERIRFAHATPLRLPDEGPAEVLVICGAAQKKASF